MSSHFYSAGKEKEHIRNYVFLHFIDCEYVVTLPNLYFQLETLLLKHGIKVDCCEHKRDIFEKQKEIAPKRVTLYNCDVENLNLLKYDGIFLDLCGTFNKSSHKLFKNIKSKTKIAVTFLMARENNSLQEFLDINNREESYITLMDTYGINITKFINYSSYPHSPMCTFFGEKQ